MIKCRLHDKINYYKNNSYYCPKGIYISIGNLECLNCENHYLSRLKNDRRISKKFNKNTD